jgi:hypothetical protein
MTLLGDWNWHLPGWTRRALFIGEEVPPAAASSSRPVLD